MSEKWVIRNKLTGRYLNDLWEIESCIGERYWRWALSNTEPKLIFASKSNAERHLMRTELCVIAEVVPYE